MADGLPCLNCSKPVESAELKLFAGAHVCADCYIMAEHFVRRADNELRLLQVLLRDGVRNALVEGNFHFNAHKPPGKQEVLKQILALQDATLPRGTSGVCRTTTPSGETTPLHVATLAAMGRDASKKPKTRG